MGGLGKSVLAAAFARSAETRRACTDGVVWVPVDQKPDLLQKIKLVGVAFNDSLANYADESMARGQLAKLLADNSAKRRIGPDARLTSSTSALASGHIRDASGRLRLHAPASPARYSNP
jgi:hypothetical protein